MQDLSFLFFFHYSPLDVEALQSGCLAVNFLEVFWLVMLQHWRVANRLSRDLASESYRQTQQSVDVRDFIRAEHVSPRNVLLALPFA